MKSIETFSSLNSVAPAAVVADSPAVEGIKIKVQLSRLFLAETNVRKNRTQHGIDELAALIESQGLMYPLCVIAEKSTKGKLSGRYGVTAGGRRLAALGLLAAKGALAADDLIDCLEFDADRAVVVSLAENSHEAMHPADMIEAFQKMVDEGRGIPEIAGVFGVSELTVQRRLKLAALAPVFLDMYRAGTIEPKQLQALALTSDHALQVQAWNSLPTYNRSAYLITKALTVEELPMTDKVVRFVGLDAYRDAGGSVRVDLFGAEGEGFVQDPQLLHMLAGKLLQERADEMRAVGWKWVEVLPSFGYSEERQYSRIYRKHVKPSPEEAFELDELDGMLEALSSAKYKMEQDTDEDDFTAEQQARYDDLEHQLSSIGDFRNRMADGLKEWGPQQIKSAGVVLSLTDEGALAVHEGLVRAEDRKAAPAATGGKAHAEPVKVKAAFSEKLMHSLTAHKTAAVSAALIDNPHVALVALLHRLIIEGRGAGTSPIKVSLTDSGYRVGDLASTFGDSPAAKAISEAKDRWGATVPGEPAALFRYLMAQDQATLNELLALQVARSFDVIQGREGTAYGFDVSGAIVGALALDMADWWTPSAALYLEHVPKAKMIEAVTEACGEAEARDILKMKKAEAIAAAAAKLDGKRWLPRPLRVLAEAEAEAAGTASGEDDAAEEDQES